MIGYCVYDTMIQDTQKHATTSAHASSPPRQEPCLSLSLMHSYIRSWMFILQASMGLFYSHLDYLTYVIRLGIRAGQDLPDVHR